MRTLAKILRTIGRWSTESTAGYAAPRHFAPWYYFGPWYYYRYPIRTGKHADMPAER